MACWPMALLPEYAMYEIRIEGHLGESRKRTFQGFNLEFTAAGETVINASIRDQAHLHFVLAKIRDIGVELVSVQRVVFD